MVRLTRLALAQWRSKLRDGPHPTLSRLTNALNSLSAAKNGLLIRSYLDLSNHVRVDARNKDRGELRFAQTHRSHKSTLLIICAL
jgi:hypothetical protein